MVLAFIAKWVLNPQWRNIHQLGAFRILGVSFASFFVIALYARGIGFARSWLKALSIGLGTTSPPLSEWISSVASQIAMPLGLKLLAISAIFAVIGKGLYEATCPQYIKVGDSFEQFRNVYSDALSILGEDFKELWNALDKSTRQKIRNDVLAFHLFGFSFMQGSSHLDDIHPLVSETIVRMGYAHPHPGANTGQQPTANLAHMLRNKDFSTAVFDVLREYRDASSPVVRRLCAFAYYLAILFAVLAILNQGRWVITTLLD